MAVPARRAGTSPGDHHGPWLCRGEGPHGLEPFARAFAEDGFVVLVYDQHHLICDGRGTPLKVITTAANVSDVTQTLALVDGIPPVTGRPGRPRRRPDSLLGDKGYDSNPNREELRKRRILPVISRKGAANIKGLGKLRYVVEQTFALLHQFKRLAVRWERRTELHDAFVSLACGLICWRRLKKHRS